MSATLGSETALQQFGGTDGRQNYIAYGTARAAAALTTSYVESTYYFDVGHYNSIDLLIKKTWADSTSSQWYVEWSHDATTWYREVGTAYSAGTNTVVPLLSSRTVGASENLIEPHPILARYVKVWAHKTGGTGADGMEIVIGMIESA